MRIPLYLHIGHPKVASSSIQVALAQNLDALRAEGYLVADADLQFPETGPLNGFPITLVVELCEPNCGPRTVLDAVLRRAGIQLRYVSSATPEGML
jgi:hypothetical protein